MYLKLMLCKTFRDGSLSVRDCPTLKFGLQSLELRRLRMDLVMCYKIVFVRPPFSD